MKNKKKLKYLRLIKDDILISSFNSNILDGGFCHFILFSEILYPLSDKKRAKILKFLQSEFPIQRWSPLTERIYYEKPDKLDYIWKPGDLKVRLDFISNLIEKYENDV